MLVLFPIVYAEEIIGLLLLQKMQSDPGLAREDADSVRMYLMQIAAPLKNILLAFEQNRMAAQLEEKDHKLIEQSDVILRKSAHLVILNEIVQQVNSTLEPNEILHALARQAAQSIGADVCAVWLFSNEKVYLKAMAAFGIAPELLPKLTLHLSDLRNTSFYPLFQERHSAIISSLHEKKIFKTKFHDLLKSEKWLAMPLPLKEQVLGFFLLGHSRETHDYNEEELNLIRSVANHAVLAIENAQLYQEMKKQAITDGLTGAYNHRFFQLRFADEFASARRYNTVFSLVMLDIDFFKKYNDTFGHMAGDLALKEIAGLLRASVRENDIVARYGGEEFVMILPMTDMKGALSLTRRIHKALATIKFLGDMNQPLVAITVSMGVATYHETYKRREAMIHHADEALYTAKKHGRNCTYYYVPEKDTFHVHG
jgi:diguanylate cyclase (GGDEF)-like protein